MNIGDHPLYGIWSAMRFRCNSIRNPSYKDYGGRGISVCKRWSTRGDGIRNFIFDMGPRPAGATLGRIDNDGNYKPSNCEWQTLKEQARNKRNNIIIEFNGQRRALPFWADELSLSPNALWKRLRIHKWSVARALTQPRRIRHPQIWPSLLT